LSGHTALFLKYWEFITDNFKKAGWSLGRSQPLVLKDTQSSLLTHIAAMESVTLCGRMKS